ncbi:unnamed protein product [Prunus armeniaca]|uniref:Uncharacterized protein n=1 Tax=Prunus armeniaca TaxID=36596 RepID=A0A6J5XAG8_PRUAR|nr:unnamed protein product [Prunus armeniaca]
MKLFQKLLKNSTFSSPLRRTSTVSSFITSNSTIRLPITRTTATFRMLPIMTAAATVSSFTAGFYNTSILTTITILGFLSMLFVLASGAEAALDDGNMRHFWWSRWSWSQFDAQVWLNPLL